MGKTVIQSHVCVGGHLDGQRYAPSKEAMLGPTGFRVKKRLKSYADDVLLTVAEAAAPLSEVSTAVDEVYELEKIVGERDGVRTEYHFWRAKGLATTTAIGMLLEGYIGSKQGGRRG